jgi:general secretion pathway protein D
LRLAAWDLPIVPGRLQAMRIDDMDADLDGTSQGRVVVFLVEQARRPRMASLGTAISMWLALGGLLCGCMIDKGVDFPARDQVTDPIRDADLRARWNGPVGIQPGSAAATPRPMEPMVFPGTGQDPAMPPSPREADRSTRVATAADGNLANRNGDVEMNFDNADIQTVAKWVLGDSLGLNYVIDPRVQGTITLASSQSIARKDVLPIFESVLRMSNAAVLREDNLIRIVPLPEAAGAGPSGFGAGQAGFGVSIVPLRYVSAAATAKTAENFLSRPGAVRVDQARNLLLIQGTTSERQAALGVIATLDVEWLRNQSVALYPLKSTAPETMIRELDKVFDTAEGGQGQGVIKFQPVSRMNAVLAVGRNSKVVERATEWVRRLDRSDLSGTTMRIYSLRFGNARAIARILNEMFVGRSGQGTLDSGQPSPIAPGQNATASRIDSLGSGTMNTNQATGTPNSDNSGTSGARSGPIQAAFDNFADRKDAEQDNAAGLGATGSGAMPRGLFQNVRITADAATNAIMVYSNQEDYRVIERALESLDRPRLQVAVDAMVAEVTLTDQLQYGVQAYLTSANAGAGPDKGSAGLFNAAQSSAQSALLARVLPGFNLLLGAEANPKLILSALSTLTSVKVLSAPSLVVADNQPAILEVGDQVPISTGTATVLSTSNTVVNTITLHNTGIILKVLPHVHPNGSIELEIEQEISNVVNSSGSGAQNLTPTISQRRIHSTVGTSSGQTVLLGGLIKEDDERTVAGIPGLNQVKYLGDLLSQKTDNKSRSEIIVFVTTKLVRNSHDAQVVAEKFRERLDTMRRTPTSFDAPAAARAPVARK